MAPNLVPGIQLYEENFILLNDSNISVKRISFSVFIKCLKYLTRIREP